MMKKLAWKVWMALFAIKTNTGYGIVPNAPEAYEGNPSDLD